MPKVRLLAPVSHDDKDFKTDDVISVDDETAAAWRAQGKASLFDYEQQLEKEARESGHYGDVVGREEVGQVSRTTSHPGPQADDDDDEDEAPRSRRGKK
jgi:hypothetical protein